MKILIVDDDINELKRVERVVLECGEHVVILATSGKGAATLFAEERPDAVITDVQMKNGNGIYLLQYIWAMETRPTLVRSGDYTFRMPGGEIFDLRTTSEIFSFAEFHHKTDEPYGVYIPEWLNGIIL